MTTASMSTDSMATTNVTGDASPFTTTQIAVLGLLAAVTSVVTIMGNLIVLLSFVVERSIRQPTNYFIASLAVSDLLIGLVSMPFYTVYLLAGQYWPLGEVLCDLWLSVDYTLCLSSIYTVCCITIDRFCSVKIPARYRHWRTERKVLAIIATVWVLPIGVFFTTIFGWQYFVGERTVAEGECYVQYMDNAVFNCLLQVGYFWVTLVVMCVLYTGIYRVALGLQQKSEAKHKKMESLVTGAGREMSKIGIGMSQETPRPPLQPPIKNDEVRETVQKEDEEEEETTERNQDTDDAAQEALLSTTGVRANHQDVRKEVAKGGLPPVPKPRAVYSRPVENERSSSPAFPSDTESTSVQSPQLHRKEAPAAVLNKKHPPKVKRSSLGSIMFSKLHQQPGERLRKLSQAFLNIHIGDGAGGGKRVGGGGRGGGGSSFVKFTGGSSGLDTITSKTSGDQAPGLHSNVKDSVETWSEELAGIPDAMPNNKRDRKITKFEDHDGAEEDRDSENDSISESVERDVGKLAPCNTTKSASVCLSPSSPEKAVENTVSISSSPIWKRQSSTFEGSFGFRRKISHNDRRSDHHNIERKGNEPNATAFPFPPHDLKQRPNDAEALTPRTDFDTQVSRTRLLPSTSVDTTTEVDSCFTDDTPGGGGESTTSTPCDSTNEYRKSRRCRPRFLGLGGGFASVRGKGGSLRRNRRPKLPAIGGPETEPLASKQSRRGVKTATSKSENRARKALRTITIILGVFIICWTPWHLLSLVLGFWPDCGLSVLYDISYWLCYINSPINPLCYALANQQFKKTFTRIIKLDWRRT